MPPIGQSTEFCTPFRTLGTTENMVLSPRQLVPRGMKLTESLLSIFFTNFTVLNRRADFHTCDAIRQ